MTFLVQVALLIVPAACMGFMLANIAVKRLKRQTEFRIARGRPIHSADMDAGW